MGIYGAGSTRLRLLALDIVRGAGVAEKDVVGEIRAIHTWVQRSIRYVRDPVGYEFITHPETLAFEIRDGDCDDHSVLEAALLGALGIPTRFVVVGMVPGAGFSHVYLEALHQKSKRWIPLDPIMKDKPAGWSVPRPATIKRYPINTVDGFPSNSLFDLAGAALLGFLGRRFFMALGWWR